MQKISPFGPQRRLMGRKFLSPDTRKSSPRLAVNVEPFGFKTFCLIEQPWMLPKMTLFLYFSGIKGVSSEIRPACAPARFLVERVVRYLFQIAIDVRVVALPGLPNVVAALHDVVQVRNHAAAEDELAVGVAPVHAPRVARPLREHLELLRLRVVAPDGRVHPRAGAVGPLRLDHRICENAVQAVQPAVRSPLECVQSLVRVLAAEAVQQHLELAGFVVLVLDEPQVRRAPT